jgi:Tol biopolymer transport system component/uncharacterized membrane protein
VVFVSTASNLVANDTNGVADVFLRDTVAGTTTRLSQTPAGVQASGAASEATISADGTTVAFATLAENLVAGDANGASDILVATLGANGTVAALTLASQAADGTRGDDGSFHPALSRTGRYVAFASRATTLVADDTNGSQDVFRVDRQTGTVARVSVASDGSEVAGDAGLAGVALSADGSVVAYASTAGDAVAGDTNGKDDLFLTTVAGDGTGTVERVSTSTLGAEANAASTSPALSGDGKVVAFASRASNLVTQDTNGVEDVFAKLVGAGVQPDLMLRDGQLGGNPVIGDGVYGVTAQTLETTARTATSVRIYLSVKNASKTVADALRVQATALPSPTAWTVTYKNASSVDVTSEVLGAGYETPTLAAGAQQHVFVDLVTYASLPTTPALDVTLTLTSTTDASKSDTARLLVHLDPYPTVLVSVNAAGKAGNGSCRDMMFSKSGRYVSFLSTATDLVTGDANGKEDVFVHDRLLGTTARVNVAADGTQADGTSDDQDMASCDPAQPATMRLIFKGTAQSLTTPPLATAPPAMQIYCKDLSDPAGLAAGVVTIESRAQDTGALANGACDGAVLAASGRYLAFTSAATNLLPGVTAGKQVYLRDLAVTDPTAPGYLRLVSTKADGSPANAGVDCRNCGISADGRYVTFSASGAGIDARDTFNKYNVYRRDLTQVGATLVSVNADGTNAANGDCASGNRAPVADDGRYVAFVSAATNLAVGDTDDNSKADIYVRDLTQPAGCVRVSRVADGGAGTQDTLDYNRPSITGSGQYLAFARGADSDATAAVYFLDLPAYLAGGVYARTLATRTYQNTDSVGYNTFFSADGRYLAYISKGTTMVPPVHNADNGAVQAYVRDLFAVKPNARVKDTDPAYTGGWVGDTATLDPTGAASTLARPLGAGATRTFQVDVLNAGSTADACTVQGAGDGPGWTVRYSTNPDGTGDITAQVVAGTYTTATLSGTATATLYLHVTADALLLTGTQVDVPVTATATLNTATRDRVIVRSTVAAGSQPDLALRAQTAADFTGDHLYNADGTRDAEQTATSGLREGASQTVVVRVRNDGGQAEAFRLVAAPVGDLTGWTVAYLDALGKTALPAALTDPLVGYQTVTLDPGQAMDVQVRLTAGTALRGGATATVRLTASTLDGVVADTGLVTATVTVRHQADLAIASFTDGVFLTDNVYEDGTAQRQATIVPRGQLAAYVVNVENDGNVTEALGLAVTTPLPAGWTVAYTDETTGLPITAAVAAGTWTVTLAPGASRPVRVEVTPGLGLAPGAVGTLALTGTPAGGLTQTDTVAAEITAAIRKPDLLLQRPADASPTGDGVYNDAPAQTLGQTVDNGVAATTTLTLQNDGNFADSYRVTGPAGGAGWTVTYYQGTTGTTALPVGSTGWTTTLAPGASQTLRVVVTPDATVAGGTVLDAAVTAASTNEPAYTDTVVARTTVQVRHQPDLLIQGVGDAGFVGDGVYGLTGQLKALPVPAGKSGAFLVRLRNAGNVPETLTLQGEAGDAAWTVRYTDPATGADRTAALVAGTPVALAMGATADLRLTLTPAPTVASGATRTVAVTATASGVQDRVRGLALLQGALTRVSVDAQGTQGSADSGLGTPVLSADGRFVVFSALATNLVPGDSNGVADLFRYDRQTGSVLRVSVNSAGVQADGASDTPAISADGRYIAFRSAAANFVYNSTSGAYDGDTNGLADVFWHDCQTGVTTRVSVNGAGAQATGGASGTLGIALSADGGTVVFESAATNLVLNATTGKYTGDTNAASDLFRRDLGAGTTTRVSVSTAGAQSDGESRYPALSADGRYLAFGSAATNLVAGDTNGCADVFLRDLQAGTTTRLTAGTAASDDPALSADGAWVAYISLATDLGATPAPTNKTWNVYLAPRTGGVPTRVSVTAAGGEPDGASVLPALSADGRFLAYSTYATNLVAGDANGGCDGVVYDRTTGSLYRVTAPVTGAATGEAGAAGLALSGDGTLVAFESPATNLVAGDTNNRRDVFVRDWTGYRADLLLRTASETAWRGDGVYGDLAAQTATAGVPAASAATYALAVENDGTLGDTLRVTGTAGAAGWTVTYTDGAGADVTAAVTGAGWTPAVASGARAPLTVTVTPDAGVAANAAWTVTVTATSGAATALGDATRGDAAQLVTTRLPLTGVTLTLAPAAQRVVGLPVTLTATPLGGSPAECSFWVKQTDATAPKWVLVRDYTREATATWTPAAVGQYTVMAKIREVGSTADYAFYKTASYTVVAPVSAVTVSTAATPPAAVGRPVPLTLTHTGGVTVEVRVEATPAGGTPVVVRDWGTGTTATWTPAAAGSYTLTALAREVGTTTTTATGTLAYPVVAALAALTLDTNPLSPGLVTAPVAVTLTPTGGAHPEYRLYAQRTDLAGQAQVVVRDWAASATATWTPTATGTYKLLAVAREQGSTAAYAVYATRTFVVAAPVAAVSLTVAPALQPQPTGTPLTLTAAASGGAHLEYAFAAGLPDAAGTVQWTALRAFALSPTAAWTPAAPGAYTLRVQVREAGTTAVAATREVAYTIVQAVSAVTLRVAPAPRGLVGTPVQLTAVPTNGVNPAYRFYVQRTDVAAAQTELRGWGTAASCAWTPAAAGTYKLLVLAREAGLTVAYQAYASATETVVAPLAAVALAVTPPGPQPVGTQVTLQASGTNGVTPQYQFLLGIPGTGGVTTWQELQAYGVGSRCVWTAPAQGSYTLRLRARDAVAPTVVTTVDAPYTVSNALTGLTLAVTPAAPRVAGMACTVTATPVGGTAPVVQVRVTADGTTWTPLQAWGPSAPVAWTPPAAGTYTVEASAKESGAATAAVTKTVTVVVTAPITGLTLACAPAAPAVGATAALLATATGGTALEYRFTSQRTDVAGAAYVELQAYGRSATCPWTPPAAGTYKLLVTVREVGDPAPYTRYATTYVTVK